MYRRARQPASVTTRNDRHALSHSSRLAEGAAATAATAPRPSAGVPFLGHVPQPSLVNLLPDPALTETVAYPLPEGDATLGASDTATVRLHGLLIDKRHW